MEYKAIPSAIKTIDGRTVVGIAAVHGNIDSYGDISHPGSFAKSIVDRGARVKYLWNHDMMGSVPTAVIKGLREVTRDELPPRVLELAPDATGGVEVTREYLDTPRGNELLTAIKAGAIDELSYGYDPQKFDFADINGQHVRNLREIKLWEVSDVIFGANPATLGSKVLVPLDLLIKQLEAHMLFLESKAGARHSTEDMKTINAMHEAAVKLGATNCAGTKSMQDTATPKAKEEEEAGKSRTDLSTLNVSLSRLQLMEFMTR